MSRWFSLAGWGALIVLGTQLTVGPLATSARSDDDSAPAEARPNGPRAVVRPLGRGPLETVRDDATRDEGETREDNAPPTVRRLTPGGSLFGKVLAVTLKSDPEYAVYLQDVQIQPLGRDSFLVGTGVDTGEEDWTRGRRTWISIDDVSQLIEFKDVAELKKLLEPEDRDPDA